MTSTEESTENGQALQKYGLLAAIVFAALAVLSTMSAGIWRMYTLLQDGLTAGDLATISLMCLLAALILFGLFGVKNQHTGKTVFEALTGGRTDD